MRGRGIELDVAVVAERVEVEELGAEGRGDGPDPFLVEDLLGVLRPAPVADGQALRALVPDAGEERRQGVVVGRAGRGIGGVEVRLDQDVLGPEGIDREKVEALLDAVGTGIGLDQDDARLGRRGLDGATGATEGASARRSRRQSGNPGEAGPRYEELPSRHSVRSLHVILLSGRPIRVPGAQGLGPRQSRTQMPQMNWLVKPFLRNSFSVS